MVMTKAAVREEVTIASPTPSPPRRATSQGLGRICLTSVTYSILLDSWLEGVRVTERGAVLFFSSHLFNILPPSRMRAFVCTAYVCLADALPLPVNFKMLFKLSHNGWGCFYPLTPCFFLHTQQGWWQLQERRSTIFYSGKCFFHSQKVKLVSTFT